MPDYLEAGHARIVQGDLFDEKVFVVPIKTNGAWYGSISRESLKRGFTIPTLSLVSSATEIRGDQTAIFVAFWSDTSEYTDAHVSACVHSAVVRAAHAGAPRVAIPLLGDKDKTAFLAAMEHGVELALDQCSVLGLREPAVVFVTPRALT